MAVAVKAIFRGNVTYASGDGTAPTAISLGGTIVTANSFVTMTTRNSDGLGRIQRHFWNYALTTTTIAFTRASSGSASSVTIEWEVIEFDSDVSVQRGNEDFGTSAATHDITISAVTEANAIVTLTGVKPAGGNIFSRTSSQPQDHYGDITSTTNVKITTVTTPGAAADSWVDSWQVIEFDSDVSIQRGLSASSGGDTVFDRTQAISAVTLARTFAVISGWINRSTTRGRGLFQLDFNSTTELHILGIDEGAMSSNTLSWATVELPSGSVVESGIAVIPDTATVPTTQPNWSTALDNGSFLHGYFMPNSKKNNTGGVQYDDFMSAMSLDSPEDSITLTRNATSNEMNVAFYAGDWPSGGAPAAAPPPSLTLTGVG